MAVNRDVAAVDLDDGGNQAGAVEIGAPVLEQDVRAVLVVAEHLDPLPDGHAVFEMLALDIVDAGGLGGAANQVIAFL